MAQLKDTSVTGNLSVTDNIIAKSNEATWRNNLAIGTGTAGQAGSSSAAYIPSLWTYDLGFTPVEGDMITVKIPVAGVNSGIWLSVDNGVTYYPVATANKTRMTTHFAVNDVLTLVYEVGMATTIYGTTKDGAAKGATAKDQTIDRWTCLNYYDTNTTYSAQTSALLIAGTNTTARTIRSDVFKGGVKGVVKDTNGKVMVYDNEVGVGLNQGTENAGKIMAINAEGVVEPGDANGCLHNAPVTDSTPEAIKLIKQCADDMPIRVEAEIAPVQDLHGYEYPWAAGCGKNLNEFTENITNTHRNISFSASIGNHFTASGTADGNNATLDYTGMHPFTFVANTTYTFSFTGTGVDQISYVFLYDANQEGAGTIAITNGVGTFVPEADSTASKIRIRLGTADGTVVSVDCNWQVEVGSTATSWVPYSNICQINGWSGITICSRNKNLIPINAEFVNNSMIDADGVIQEVSTYRRMSTYMIVKPNTTYTISITKGNSTSTGITVPFYDANKNFISRAVALASTTATGRVSGSFTTPSNAMYCVFSCAVGATLLQIELGDTATDFITRYAGSDTVINFPTPPGTVYGGTLTINKDGSGTLTVDKVSKTITSSTTIDGYAANSNGAYRVQYSISSEIPGKANTTKEETICNAFQQQNPSTCYNFGSPMSCALADSGKYILITLDSSYSDVQKYRDLVDDIGGITVVYPAETPTSYELTAEQIRTVLGDTYVFCDTGDILSIETSGSKEYIESIIPGVATTTTDGLMSATDKAKLDSISETLDSGSTYYLADGDDIEDIADAIRAKTGGTSSLAFPADFISGISSIAATDEELWLAIYQTTYFAGTSYSGTMSVYLSEVDDYKRLSYPNRTSSTANIRFVKAIYFVPLVNNLKAQIDDDTTTETLLTKGNKYYLVQQIQNGTSSSATPTFSCSLSSIEGSTTTTIISGSATSGTKFVRLFLGT